MKVCFVTEDFYPDFIGGQGIYGKNLVENLTKKGIEITVLAEKKKERKEFWKNKKNISVILVPFCFGLQLVLGLLEYLYFKIRLNNFYFDIVHANQISGLFFVVFKPRNVGKVVVSMHNANYDMQRSTSLLLKKILYYPSVWLEGYMYRNADGVICNSPVSCEDLILRFDLKNPAKPVYLAAEQAKFNSRDINNARKDVRKQLGLSPDSKIILYIGRLSQRKRIDTIIKAVSLLRQRNIFCLIIGKGAEEPNLRQLKSPNTFFLGKIEDTRDYLLASDVFVTVSEAEGGFSLSVLQAASYGLPLVVSRSLAGFPIIKEGMNGFIVDPDDYKSLSKKIILCLGNKNRMARISRQKSLNFSWKKTASETLDFYCLVLGKRRYKEK